MNSIHPHRATRQGLALTAAALLVGGLMPGVARANTTISSPAPGVICDAVSRTCYDANGISLPLTRQHMGSWAEWRLARQLAGQPLPTEFRLSDGSVCELRSRSCWSEQNGRRRPASQLSEQLFGSANANASREVNRFTGRCHLMRGNRELYSGLCALRRVANSERGVTRYVVRRPDGSQLTFSDRSGSLEASDGDRSWPATFVDHGYTGVFRWRDMTLVATREHAALPLGRLPSEGISQLFLDR